MIEQINWLPSCCAWHGDYAEHATPTGTLLRIKRGPSVDGYLIMVFKDNQCQTLDENGVPEYENISEQQLVELMMA